MPSPLSTGPDPVPLAAASNPVGTVSRNRNVALSEGWSLPGNHVAAPAGSLAT